MKLIVYADYGSWQVCINTLVGQIDKLSSFMETQTWYGVEHNQM